MSKEQELIQEMGESFAAERKLGERAREELKKHDRILAETQEKIDKVDSVYAEAKANADKLADVEKKNAELETMISRINQGSGKDVEGKSYLEAINDILHGSGGSFDPSSYGKKGSAGAIESGESRKEFRLEIDQKGLSTDIAPNGGYFLQPDRSGRTVETVFATSPMRSLASVQTTGQSILEGLYDGDEPTSQVSPERGSRSENTTPQVGVWRIDLKNYNTNLTLTRNMRDDADFDVIGWLARKAQAKLMRAQNADFVNGDGALGARGFTTYADGTTRGTVEQVAATGAMTYTMGDVVKLPYALNSEYKTSDAAYVGHRTVIGDMRTKALTGNDSGLVWQPSLAAGQPDALNGYRVVEFEDMPDATTAFGGAGNIFLAFANWRDFYQIAEKSTIDLLVDEFTVYPNIMYRWNSRVGGDVVNFEAGKLLITGS